MQDEKRKPSWTKRLILVVRGGVMLTAVLVLLYVWFRPSPKQQPAVVTINISATGDLEVDGRSVQPATLTRTLLRERKRLESHLTDPAGDVTLVIQQDARSPREQVSFAVKTALEAGFTDVNLKMQPTRKN